MTTKTCCTDSRGHPDTDLMDEEGTCVFGCGTAVDTDMWMCPRCHEHSGNRFECEDCGAAWENWGQGWRRAD